ncbi:GNAT family N-acetyltransferase [Arenibacter sp. GZD96]|uniref:GNAT family N-acetyltransferase n=1 Tax=Aurantibrevibacter litoralis TaxID=3106030 RepID=UPI002AFDFE34|nr:GNAT family N-acetyltransferase [Arenibacter sp. GZD-96]MEA1787386.1 GNAT family N-acetyltransferase [Arenibacter sp. GZD-96]
MAYLRDNKSTITRFFLENFLNKRDLYPFYTKVTNTLSKKVIYDREIPKNMEFRHKTYVLKDVPNYLYAEIPEIYDGLKINRIATYEGFAIDLKQYQNLEDYLKFQLGKTSRSKIRRYQNRLETCFDISYTFYYGEIAQATYDDLLDRLKTMLERRFEEKKEANYELQHWESFHCTMRPLILEKKAFLFVIYDGDKAIDITLNVVYDDMVFSNISSYDVDYAAFSLGTIDMVKHIEWCFDQNFGIIDLLKGYHYYKKRWINCIYTYERHIIYDSNSFVTSCRAKIKTLKVSLFYHFFRWVKKWRLDEPIQKFKTYRYTIKTKTRPLALEPEVMMEPYPPTVPEDRLELISIKSDTYRFLRKSVYGLAYGSSEKADTIKVFRFLDRTDAYLVAGKHKKVVLKVSNVQNNK